MEPINVEHREEDQSPPHADPALADQIENIERDLLELELRQGQLLQEIRRLKRLLRQMNRPLLRRTTAAEAHRDKVQDFTRAVQTAANHFLSDQQ